MKDLFEEPPVFFGPEPPQGMLVCRGCDTTLDVQMEASRTMYDPGPLTFWEAILLDGEDRPDPNADIPLCRECAVDHHANWDEMWSMYYSSVM